MPKISAVSNISLPCRDLATSVGWWHQVLGLAEVDYSEGEGWRSVTMVHVPSSTTIELREHDSAAGGDAEDAGSRFGRLGFGVATRADLEHWEDFLLRLGVDHAPVTDRDGESVLAFSDPDGLPLEIRYRERPA